MNDRFVLDTVESIRLINNSPELRQTMADFAKNLAINRVYEIILDERLSKQEKDEKLSIIFVEYEMLQIQALRCGKENLTFPANAFTDQFIDWLMTQRKEVSPWIFYIIAIASIYAGRFALDNVNLQELELPAVYNDVDGTAIGENFRTQEFTEDSIPISMTDVGPIAFSESEALQRLIGSLGKYPAAKARRTTDTRGLAEDLALMGAWEASLQLLEKSAQELLSRAFATKYLQNYLHKAIQKELAYELRKESKDKARSKHGGFEQVEESDLPHIKDDEGNEISPMEQIPQIPQEDQEVIEAKLFEALELTDMEKEILTSKVQGLKKREIARRVDISRPTLDKHLKAIREKAKSLKAGKSGVSRFREDESTFQTAPTRRIPDPAAHKAIAGIMRRNLLKLTS